MYLTDSQKYQLLIEISHKLGDTLDLDEILDHLLDVVKTVVDYDAAGIFVLNQDLVHGRGELPKEVIAGIARRGFDLKHPDEDAMLTFGKGIIGHVIFTGTCVIVPDVRTDARYVEGRSRTRSEIAVPIVQNNKPIGALNLESDQESTFNESDLEALQFFADAAAISIEKAMLHRQLVEKKLIDKQLQLARDVQSRLFPSGSPRIAGYDIAGICIPAEEIGGDYYDFINLRHAGLGVVVADVSGNGIAAALVMSAFRGLLRTHTRGKLDPAKVARAINRQLPEFTGGNHFVTAAGVTLYPGVDEFTYVCCGQQPPLLIHPDGSLGTLDVRGPALGIFNNVHFPTEVQPLARGDILVLYTDGVVDMINQEGVGYGDERLAAALHQARNLPADELVQGVVRATREFSGSESYRDDFTLVVIKRV